MAYRLDPALHLLPTPAGAFNAVAGPAGNRPQRFLVSLLRDAHAGEASESNLRRWTGFDDIEEAGEFVWRMQEMGWIQALDTPRPLPEAPLEEVLPTLLPALCPDGKVLLADTQGFYLYSHGFPHEVAEELSALSADLATLHQRRSGSLNRNLGLSGSAWALTDAAGHSQIGFWPLHIGSERFVLVIAGQPAFNRPQLVDLVVFLHQRFAASAQ